MKLEIQRYLPIGSVVLLKNATKKLMITGFCMGTEVDGKTVYYDYIGCFWPEGILQTDKNLLFNHDDIAEVIANGYSTEEVTDFKEKLSTVIKNKNINLANPTSGNIDEKKESSIEQPTNTVKQEINISPVSNNNDELL